MNYELAKQLKDAGFPLKERVIMSQQIGNELHQISEWYPTLSELIEACGEEFSGLDRDKDSSSGEVYWLAKAWSLDKNTYGSTPEESVANLWLKLNENKN